MLVAIYLVIPQRMHLSGTVTKIWCLKDNGVMTLTFCGHVTSSVTRPFDSWVSTTYGWSIVTLRLSSTVLEIWPFKFFQKGSSRNRGRSSIGFQYYTDHIYLFSLRWERSSRGVINDVTVTSS